MPGGGGGGGDLHRGPVNTAEGRDLPRLVCACGGHGRPHGQICNCEFAYLIRSDLNYFISVIRCVGTLPAPAGAPD